MASTKSTKGVRLEEIPPDSTAALTTSTGHLRPAQNRKGKGTITNQPTMVRPEETPQDTTAPPDVKLMAHRPADTQERQRGQRGPTGDGHACACHRQTETNGELARVNQENRATLKSTSVACYAHYQNPRETTPWCLTPLAGEDEIPAETSTGWAPTQSHSSGREGAVAHYGTWAIALRRGNNMVSQRCW